MPSTNILNNVIVATSGSQTSSGINLEGVAAFGIGFRFTFNASTAAGARIDIYGDPTGATTDFTIGAHARVIDSQSIPLGSNAGQEVEGVLEFFKFANRVKAVLVNESSAQTITGASLWSQV